jgi:hypothetical protein
VPINLLKLRIEFLSILGTRRLDGPVLLRLEGANLPLPLDDQAEGDGLYSPGGESGLDAVPEDGAGLVAHQTIENPACLLRLHLVVVNDARFGDGLLDRIFGNLVEQDPVQRCLGIQLVGHVPRDRLTLAIGVRCQVHSTRRLGCVLQLVKGLGLSFNSDVLGLKPVVDVDAELPGRKVPHMSDRGFDIEAPAKVLADALGLGRGFHHHERIPLPSHRTGGFGLTGALPRLGDRGGEGLTVAFGGRLRRGFLPRRAPGRSLGFLRCHGS